MTGAPFACRSVSRAVADLADRGRAPVCVHAYEADRRAIAFYECADGVIRLDDGDGTGVAAVRLVLS